MLVYEFVVLAGFALVSRVFGGSDGQAVVIVIFKKSAVGGEIIGADCKCQVRKDDNRICFSWQDLQEIEKERKQNKNEKGSESA